MCAADGRPPRGARLFILEVEKRQVSRDTVRVSGRTGIAVMRQHCRRAVVEFRIVSPGRRDLASGGVFMHLIA
jgi:hypothetical protein